MYADGDTSEIHNQTESVLHHAAVIEFIQISLFNHNGNNQLCSMTTFISKTIYSDFSENHVKSQIWIQLYVGE